MNTVKRTVLNNCLLYAKQRLEAFKAKGNIRDFVAAMTAIDFISFDLNYHENKHENRSTS